MTGWLIQARDLRTGLRAAIVLSRMKDHRIYAVGRTDFAATRYTTEPRND